jgi:hypothetical protein
VDRDDSAGVHGTGFVTTASERCCVTDDRPPARFGELVRCTAAAYGRAFGPLFAIVSVIVLPLAIVQSLAPIDTAAFDDLRKLLSLPPGERTEAARLWRALGTHAPNLWVTLASVLTFVALPLVRSAAFIAGSDVFDGRMPSLAGTYRAAVQRWLPQIVTQLVFAVAVVAGVLGAVLAFGVAVALIVLASLASRLVAIALSTILAVALIAAAASAAAFAYLAWHVAAARVATVEPNPVRAVGTTARQLSAPALRGHVLRLGLGLAAFEFTAAIVMLIVAGLAASTRIAAVPALAIGACAVVVEGLRAIFVLAYVRTLDVSAAATP